MEVNPSIRKIYIMQGLSANENQKNSGLIIIFPIEIYILGYPLPIFV